MNHSHSAREPKARDNGASTGKPPAVAPGLSNGEVERRLKLYGTTAPDWAIGRLPRRYF